jgi:hypothetical protein
MSTRISLVAGRPRIELITNDPSQPVMLTVPAQGPRGDTGLKGDQGFQGSQGPQGVQGERGQPGDTTSKVLQMSAVASTHTGNTTETALATITVPARAMGKNGRLRVTTFFSMPSSASAKTFRVRLNGIAGTVFYSEAFGTGILTAHAVIEIANRDSASSQIGGPINSSGLGSSTSAIVTSAINTDNADVALVISGQLAASGETIKLEGYLVELMQPPQQAAIGLYFAGDGIVINPTTFEVKVDRATVPTKASPAFTGTPTAPTPADADDSTKLATTEFVHNLVNALSNVYMTGDPEDARTLMGLGALALLSTVSWNEINASLRATAADYRGGVDQKFLTAKNVYDAQAYVGLTDAATIAVDLATGINFTVTLSTNRILGFPTGLKIGQSGFIDIVQPPGGGKLLDFAAGYTFDNGAKPVVDTVTGRITSLYYHVRSGGEVRIAIAFNGVRAIP